MYYVYIIVNSKTDEPFYVGKGKANRKFDHFRDARLGKCANKHLERTILKLWASNVDALVEVVYETEDEHEAHDFERSAIAHFGRRDLGTGSLVNLTNGGEGVSGRSRETIERNTASSRSTKLSWSPEQRSVWLTRLSLSHREKWRRMTPELKRERLKHLEAYRSSLSKEQREARRRHLRRIHADYWASNDSIRHGAEVSRSYHSKPDHLKVAHRANIQTAVADQWKSMHPGTKAARMQRMRDHLTPASHAKTSATMRAKYREETAEARSARIARHKAAASKVNHQDANRRAAATRAAWSEEQKKAYSCKMRAAANRRWSKEKNIAPPEPLETDKGE